MSVLSAFYDLKVSPATFDIFEFLYQAEIERLDGGFADLDVFIVANDQNDGFREEITSAHPLDELNWRLRHILLPSGSLLPSTRRVVHVPDRLEVKQLLDRVINVFPWGYSIDHPIASYLPSEMLLAMYAGKPLGTFCAPPAALKAAQTWLNSHAAHLKPIVITIRASSIHSWRNSLEDQWVKFIDWLDKETYFPVIINDTERLFTSERSPFDAYAQFDIGALDLQLRLGIYECAYLNMMLSSGPATLCFLDDATKAIRFKMLAPADQTSNYPSRGFQWGMQWPNTTPFQKSVWEEDRFEILVNEFNAMVSIIEGREASEERSLPDILKTISLFIAGENFTSAETLLRSLIAQEQDNPEFIFLLAKTMHGQGAFEEAIQLFQKLGSEHEDNSEILAGWGKSLLKNGEYQKAVEILNCAWGAGTQDPFALIDLADAYCALSKIDEALQMLNKTSALLVANSESIASWEAGKRMIDLLYLTGEKEKAEELLQNMRDRFGHFSEISATLDALRAMITSEA